jgi:hypothetical protein
MFKLLLYNSCKQQRAKVSMFIGLPLPWDTSFPQAFLTLLQPANSSLVVPTRFMAAVPLLSVSGYITITEQIKEV